jgi:hypothetical protein
MQQIQARSSAGLHRHFENYLNQGLEILLIGSVSNWTSDGTMMAAIVEPLPVI